MPKIIKIVELRKTCTACPAQWEGVLDDGRAIYIRYRWGTLTIDAGDNIDSAIGGQYNILYTNVGGGFDGFLDFAGLKKAAKPREWPEIEWPETDGVDPNDDSWF